MRFIMKMKIIILVKWLMVLLRAKENWSQRSLHMKVSLKMKNSMEKEFTHRINIHTKENLRMEFQKYFQINFGLKIWKSKSQRILKLKRHQLKKVKMTKRKILIPLSLSIKSVKNQSILKSIYNIKGLSMWILIPQQRKNLNNGRLRKRRKEILGNLNLKWLLHLQKLFRLKMGD